MPIRSISVLLTWLVVGCATTSQSAQPAGEDEQLSSLMQENAASDDEDVTGQDQCLDESNEPLQCERDADCCEGFSCGWDPQVSKVVKVCVYSGATEVAVGSE